MADIIHRACSSDADSARPGGVEASALPADVHTYLEDPGSQARTSSPTRPAAPVCRRRRRSPRRSAEPVGDVARRHWRLDARRPSGERSRSGFWRTEFGRVAWLDVEVPHTWQSDDLDHPIFRNVATEMVPDDRRPRVRPRDANPTGAYVRRVRACRVDVGRTGGRVVRFDGVTSAGSCGSTAADVGLRPGRVPPGRVRRRRLPSAGHATASRVQVHRWSAGSYLRGRRPVALRRHLSIGDAATRLPPPGYQRPRTITTDLDTDYRDARRTAGADVEGRRRTAESATGTQVTATLVRPSCATWFGRGRGRAQRYGGNRSPAAARSSGCHAEIGDTPALVDPRDPEPLHAAARHCAGTPAGTVDPLDRADRSGSARSRSSTGRCGSMANESWSAACNRAETDPDTGRHVTRAAHRAGRRVDEAPAHQRGAHVALPVGPVPVRPRRTARAPARRRGGHRDARARELPVGLPGRAGRSGRTRSPTGSGRWSSGTRTTRA